MEAIDTTTGYVRQQESKERHTVGVLEWSDTRYALLRQVLARRQTFFEDIRALTRYVVFDSWQHLIEFMIRGLEIESRLEPQPATKPNTS